MKKLVYFFPLLLIACKTPVKEIDYSAKVWGNCDKCKSTIENASKLNGVSTAVWDENSKLLNLKLDTTVIKANQVLEAIAKAGYDNESFSADDYAYSNLPECCQYERK